MLGSVTVDETLFFLKIAFLVLLYLFIWRVVKTASRDLRSPQESIVLGPREARRLKKAAQAPPRPAQPAGHLVVVRSTSLPAGSLRPLAGPVTVGRAAGADVVLERDEYASSRHARFDVRRDGVWLEDSGSTNGTFLNGGRVGAPVRLSAGDVIRIGDTELRFEP